MELRGRGATQCAAELIQERDKLRFTKAELAELAQKKGIHFTFRDSTNHWLARVAGNEQSVIVCFVPKWPEKGSTDLARMKRPHAVHYSSGMTHSVAAYRIIHTNTIRLLHIEV